VLKNLSEINDQAYKVGVVMENIAKASEQQTQAVEQVNGVIGQMSTVTQHVAANAEESASGSEQLFGLAEELKGMVYAFSLSGRKTDGGFYSMMAEPSIAAAERSMHETPPVSNQPPSAALREKMAAGAGKAEDIIPFDEAMLGYSFDDDTMRR
jgi:methyl-accepting chemotaxis protein